MREGRPSFTAAAVSAARAVGGVDPVAAELLPRYARPLLAAAARAPAFGRLLNVASLGLVDHTTLRTRAIDAALEESIARGVRQLVILGAGLDARAYRMPALREVTVFEVDHPWTQAYKREHTRARAPSAVEVRMVAVDFERDSLDEELARAGHDAAAPTFWIWEGVTPYLPRAAIEASLAVIGARSASDAATESALAVTYVTPEATTLAAPLASAAMGGFRLIGEPVRGQMSPDEMRAALARHGFEVESDTGSRDWAKRFASELDASARPILVVLERLAVGVRRR